MRWWRSPGPAYAQLAGLPAYVGLYAPLLLSVVAACSASSPQLNTGPVALTSLLHRRRAGALALPGSDTWLVLAVQLALLAGLLQLAFGALRLAHFADLLSHPVLHGFINACSVLICLAQLPALLGVIHGAGQLPFVEGWPIWPAACPPPTCRPRPGRRGHRAADAPQPLCAPLAGHAAGHRRAHAGLVRRLRGPAAGGGHLPEQDRRPSLPATDWRQITDLLPRPSCWRW